MKVEQRQVCNKWPRYQVNIRASSVRLTWTGIEQGRLEAQRATREHLELLRERWARILDSAVQDQIDSVRGDGSVGHEQRPGELADAKVAYCLDTGS